MARKWKEVTVENGVIWDKEDPIEGTFASFKQNVGPNSSNLYTITTDDGDISVWGSTVLDDKLMGLPVGSYVKIEYEGKLKSQKGTEYHGYKVFFDENEAPEESGYEKAKATAAKIKGEDDVPADIFED